MSATTSSRRQIATDPPVPWMHGAAGIMGGALSMTIFYPLDLIRTRVQAQDGTTEKRLRGVSAIVRQEGVGGLYRGVGMAVTAHSVGWGTYLTIFRFMQNQIRNVRGCDSTMGDFLGASIAAVSTATLVTPFNLLKTRAQLKDKPQNLAAPRRGVFGALSHIARTEGAATLFRGVGPQILLSSHTTVQVALYERIKRMLWSETEAPVSGIALASAVSKAAAAVITNPLEVCRTRLQDARNAGNLTGMNQAFKHIYNHEGLCGLYRGSLVNVCRVVPTTVVAFIAYEKCLQAFSAMSRVKQRFATKQRSSASAVMDGRR